MTHSSDISRRSAMHLIAIAGVAPLGSSVFAQAIRPTRPLFEISLAEWSLHRELGSGKITNLDFPQVARKDFGIDAIEYVNSFFKDKARDTRYLSELKKRCDDLEVRSQLIMCDGEGRLGDPDDAARNKAVDNHHKWLDAARALECHSIRVNAASAGTFEDQQKLAADGLRKLTELAEPYKLNVIVENHGGLSSNGQWLAGVMKLVDHQRCGTLPDFGNFNLGGGKTYDRYKGVSELMPYARAVSAKSYDFDDKGNETKIDYFKMMKIVVDAGYHGHVGIEYEGSGIGERQGIMATRKLLERVRTKLTTAK